MDDEGNTSNPIGGCKSLDSITLTGTGNLSVVDGVMLVHNNSILVAYPSANGDIELDSITKIGHGAFLRCDTLINVNFPYVTDVGVFAFGSCTNLESVKLPLVTNINKPIFNGCTNLKKIELPAAKSICSEAFTGCQALEYVDLSSVESIGIFCFLSTGGTSLTIKMGNKAPTVGYRMFDGVSVPKNVTVEIPAGATGYGSIPGTYNSGNVTENWGHAFRGIGWNGTSYLTGNPPNSVTLEIKYQE